MKRTSRNTAKRPDQRHRKAAGVASQAAPARGRSKPDWMDCLDRIHGCCRVVEMLGHLLEGQRGEPLVLEAVREAGGAVVDQVKELRAALTDLEAAR